jgi:hypothetical protein
MKSADNFPCKNLGTFLAFCYWTGSSLKSILILDRKISFLWDKIRLSFGDLVLSLTKNYSIEFFGAIILAKSVNLLYCSPVNFSQKNWSQVYPSFGNSPPPFLVFQ